MACFHLKIEKCPILVGNPVTVIIFATAANLNLISEQDECVTNKNKLILNLKDKLLQKKENL